METDREAVAVALESRGDTAAGWFARRVGYSYDPARQTPNDGLRETAEDLADAERFARERGWIVGWADDWGVGDHEAEYGDAYAGWSEGSHTCEQACLMDAEGTPLGASLSCVDDADADYRRVIEAELASEAMAEILRVISA